MARHGEGHINSRCNHAATRTEETSPICTHVRSILVCGFLWGYVV